MSPYLQLLLNRKRILLERQPMDEMMPDGRPAIGPTIPIGRRMPDQRDRGIGGKLRNLQIPFLPKIPGVFNDAGVEEAKRNIEYEPNYDPMNPRPNPDAIPALSQEPTIPLRRRLPPPTTSGGIQNAELSSRPVTNPNDSGVLLRPRPQAEGAAFPRPPVPVGIQGESGMAQGPTVPTPSGAVAPDATIAVRPRSRVEEAADTVRNYQAGLHIDPKTGQWVPYKRNKALQTLEGIGTVAAGMFGIPLQGILHPRGTPEQQARRQLGTEIALSKSQQDYDLAQSQIEQRTQKPPAASTRIVNEGEYEGIPAGTEIRQTWNPQTRRMIDTIGANGGPVVSKPPKQSIGGQFITNDKDEVMLAPKNGGPARPVLDNEGKPLKKKSALKSGIGRVQTGHRLDDDGITVIQTQRDPESGRWVDSIGPDGEPVRLGQVGKIDPGTGAPVATLIENNRVVGRERSENERKRTSYEAEAKEWGGKETTFRQNKAIEDQQIKAKQDEIAKLNAERRSWTPTMLGGRSKETIDADIDRLKKEIETHRTNSQKFQTSADQAAGEATKARRNAGLYSATPQPGNAKPGKIKPGENAEIRDYANKFYMGDYNAAQKAIAEQRARRAKQ